jgi:hypothetical protein
MDSLKLYYVYDDVLKLWLIFVDDITMYISANQLEEYDEQEFKIHFVTQVANIAVLPREICYH